jgi:hypothetical protein
MKSQAHGYGSTISIYLVPNFVSKLRNEFSANMYINLAREITLEFVSELKQGHGDDYPIT